MIKGIYSSDFSSTNFSSNSKSKKNIANDPIARYQSNAISSGYTLNNLKANYMPLSFKGDETKHYQQVLTLDEFLASQDEFGDNPAKIVITDLTPEQRIKGNFYKELSDNLATVIGANKNAVLEMEEGVNPEIFVDSFAKNIQNGRYSGTDFKPYNTDVVFITNPIDFTLKESMNNAGHDLANKITEMIKGMDAKDINSANFKIDQPVQVDKSFTDALNDSLLKMETSKNKIVFIDNFEPLIDQLSKSGFATLDQALEASFPDTRIVGITQKLLPAATGVPEQDAMNLAKVKELDAQLFEGIPRFALSGLSTSDTKTLLKQNPEMMDDALEQFDDKAFFSISEKAIDEIVDMAANAKKALPKAALESIPFIVASTANDTSAPLSPQSEFKITANHVKKYYQKHAKIAQQFMDDKKFDIVADTNGKMTDLAGLESAKEEVADTLDFLKNPKAFLANGRKTPGGLLFVGPPGTGKSEMIRAIAGEVKKETGKNIPIIYLTDTGSKYINSGQNAVKETYQNAREYLRKIGSDAGIIVIEEADKICRKIDPEHAEDGKTTDELKIQMDSISTKGSDVKLITIATTNHPEVFDDALLRPSRFKQVHFDVPETQEDIVKLLKIHSKNKPFADEVSKMAMFEDFAPTLKGLNGDQMTQILDEATRVAIKEKRKIGMNDLVEGLFKTTNGPKVSSKDLSLQDRMDSSLHELGHAINTPEDHILIAISNESRDIPGVGRAAAFVAHVPKPKSSHNFSMVIDELACSYGGGEAEKLRYAAHGSGVSNDYSKISEEIEHAIKRWNLGVYTPAQSFYSQAGQEIESLSRQYDKELKMDNELFAQTGQRVSKMRLNAYKDFAFNVYLKEQEENLKKVGDGKSYLGKDFEALKLKWLQDTGRIKALPVLEEGVAAVKTIAFNDKFWTQKAKVENARMIMSDAVEEIVSFSQEKSWLDNPKTQADALKGKIDEIVNLSENGGKWMFTVGNKNLEQKLVKAVNSIVESAKGLDKKDILSFVKKTIKSYK